MKQVFISHDTESDGPFAQRLAKDLGDLDVDVWIAPTCIRPGEQWIDAIGRGLETSTHFALVSTPRAYLSSWVRKEYNAALLLQADGEIEVLPLEVEKAKIPLFLREFQLISFHTEYAEGLRQLADLLSPASKSNRDQRPAVEREIDRSLSGSGAIAQGSGAVAAGTGSVYIGGSGDSNIRVGAIGPSRTKKPARVFVAYDVRDKEYANRLSQYLETEGVNKWMAPNSIEPGTRWDVAIADAIVDSTAMIVIMSPHSSESRWVQQELRVAAREAIPIYPILLAGDPFESLRKYHFVDGRAGELPSDRLIQRLKNEPEKA